MNPQFLTIAVWLAVVTCSTYAEGEQRMFVGVQSKDGIASPGGIESDALKVDVSQSDSWGYTDQTAHAGKLFEYWLIADGVGKVNQVSETGSRLLPIWLNYDAEKGLLEGVPTTEDVGKTFQIEVKFTEAGDRPSASIVDTFEIRVADESSSSQPAVSTESESSPGTGDTEVPRPIRCLPGSAVTTATVVVDANLAAMSGTERSNMLRAFGTHLELPVSGLRLSAASGSAPVDDGSALVAGAGNVPATTADEGRPRVTIQWEVGCGNVFAAHMSVLHHVETSALDGTMAAAIGRGIVGWHVANKKPASPTRLRRQVPRLHPTATPTVSVTPPTRRPIPTTTIKDPEPTIVEPVPTTRPTSRPPQRTRTMATTLRPTRPPKTTKERTQRTTTVRTTTTTAAVPVVAKTSRATTPKRLEPSVVTKPTTPRQTDVPTPPLVITKAAPTAHPPLEWSGSFNGFDVSVNEIVDRALPSDAFRGGAPGRLLKLELRTEDGLSASMSWLKLNQTSYRFYGMPMETHVGSRDYIIRAVDDFGSSAQGKFTAEVTMRPRVIRPAYESSATLNLDYDTFCENDLLRLDVANKLAGAFGDPDARHLAITRVARGSVVLAWTNASLSAGVECPDDQIAEIQSKMFNKDGTLRDSFQEAIKPYTILGVEMTQRSSCGSDVIRATPGAAPVISRTESPAIPSTSVDPGSLPKAAAAGSSMTIVIVVLIVAAVVILVVVAVVCLCCRRRRKKSESPDKKIKPGAPIILAYELDNMDASMTPSKPLIGAGTERPPAPPDYQLATGANGATPPTDHRRPLLASDAAVDQMSPLKYQPPPGSATTRGQQPPGQRRVPPYVASN